jgi:hypothetical protein
MSLAMSAGGLAQVAAGAVYITSWINWLGRFCVTIEPSIRRWVGRRLGVRVTWSTTTS